MLSRLTAFWLLVRGHLAALLVGALLVLAGFGARSLYTDYQQWKLILRWAPQAARDIDASKKALAVPATPTH
jgi:hypothetical protein